MFFLVQCVVFVQMRLRKKLESTTQQQQQGPTIQNSYLESQSFPPSTSSFE